MIHVIISFSCSWTPSSRTFITKGNANNGRNPPTCPFLALMTPFAGKTSIKKLQIVSMKKP